jgi:hypothetical protein
LIHFGEVVCALGVLAVLAFLAVFLRIGFAKAPPPDSESAERAAFMEHGFALSEIGMTWAELSQCPGLELRHEWGSGVLALAVRARVEAAELERETKAQAEIAHLRRCLDMALGVDLPVEPSRADGEAADTAQGQGCSAEG